MKRSARRVTYVGTAERLSREESRGVRLAGGDHDEMHEVVICGVCRNEEPPIRLLEIDVTDIPRRIAVARGWGVCAECLPLLESGDISAVRERLGDITHRRVRLATARALVAAVSTD